jgi:SAM-dependent methyltransferase
VGADHRCRDASLLRCRRRGDRVHRAGEPGALSSRWILATIRRVERDALEINRAWWDGAAVIHGDDPIYDSDALIAGADWLGEEEQTALAASVGSVDGLDVIHVQCHIGFDTISLARRGARVTGLDFSPAALAKAEELARHSGVEATWVQADAARIPANLHGRFDLAYATIGAISWIEDLPAWMRSVAATLRPGGRFVLVEIHPLLTMVAEREPLSLDFPYSFDGPHRFNEPGTYADPSAELASSETVNFAHSLGETVTAAIEAGLRIDSLTEHVEASKSPRPPMVPREADGRYRLRLDGQPLPILFTLLATKLGG